jgi:hypothetical protein
LFALVAAALGLLAGVFAGAGAAKVSKHKTLPKGHSNLIARSHGHVILAVGYDVNNHLSAQKLGVPAKAGFRYVGIRVGIQNLSKPVYKAFPQATAYAADSSGKHRYRAYAARQVKPVLGRVKLGHYGRKIGYVTFLVKATMDVRRFEFRPFGKAGKLVVLHVE